MHTYQLKYRGCACTSLINSLFRFGRSNDELGEWPRADFDTNDAPRSRSRNFQRRPSVFQFVLGVGASDFDETCLIELDRDTLHTRLGSAHECHSGVRLCAFALVSLMPVGLALHGPSHRFRLLRLPRIRIEARAATGFGCCAFRGSGSRQGRRELEPYPTSRARGTLTAGTAVASYTGEIPLYTADLSACRGTCDPGRDNSIISLGMEVICVLSILLYSLQEKLKTSGLQ
uniref:Uncharacterized protein n=1 Tax=Ananas comosus var. bracteatus TaxID=296719 RepID=A0A6V7NSI9_ANACO|nr:unnamed protein product [Ananas comosus var. bracteatus]